MRVPAVTRTYVSRLRNMMPLRMMTIGAILLISTCHGMQAGQQQHAESPPHRNSWVGDEKEAFAEKEIDYAAQEMEKLLRSREARKQPGNQIAPMDGAKKVPDEVPSTASYTSTSTMINKGRDGEVFKGWTVNGRTPVAIKAIKKNKNLYGYGHLYHAPTWVHDEYTFLQRADHPNIIQVYGFEETYDKFCIITEYCSGGDMYGRQTKLFLLSENNKAEILFQMFDSIQYLHSINIMHLDVKLENYVFVSGEEGDDYWRPKLIDFGFAQIIGFGEYNLISVGTDGCQAPEVIEGQYNTAADVWSLGVAMFEIVFGYQPFHDGNPLKRTKQNHKVVNERIKDGFTDKKFKIQGRRTKSNSVRLLSENNARGH